MIKIYEDWIKRIGKDMQENSDEPCALYSGWDCPNDTFDCEKCFKVFMDKYNKQIRTDTINECIEMVKSHSDDDKLMNSWYVELLEQLKKEE